MAYNNNDIIYELLRKVFLPAELQKTHKQEKNQLTETFQAAESVLTVRTFVAVDKVCCSGHMTVPPRCWCVCVCVFLTLCCDWQGRVEQLTSELQVYNELKRRVQESTFKKDLQRNIQVCVSDCDSFLNGF